MYMYLYGHYELIISIFNDWNIFRNNSVTIIIGEKLSILLRVPGTLTACLLYTRTRHPRPNPCTLGSAISNQRCVRVCID